MAHHDYRRPTLPGAVPQETYERTATPVFLVNQDGSARRRDDTDDTGAQQRRVPVSVAEHRLSCWEDPAGSGHQLRVEVASIKTRIATFGGGTALIFAVGMAILAAWLSSRFAAAERSSVKREDLSLIHI